MGPNTPTTGLFSSLDGVTSSVVRHRHVRSCWDLYAWGGKGDAALKSFSSLSNAKIEKTLSFCSGFLVGDAWKLKCSRTRTH
jgi:hypothetical protein